MRQPPFHALLRDADPSIQTLLQGRVHRGSVSAAMPFVVLAFVVHSVFLLLVPLAAAAGYFVARRRVYAHLIAARG